MDIQEHLKALNATRARVWNEAKAHLDDCQRAHPGDEMSAEENEKWTRMNARIDAIDVEIRELSASETREREAAVSREAMEREFGTTGLAQREQAEVDSVRSWMQGKVARHDDPDEPRRNTLAIPMAAVIREKNMIAAGATAEEVRALAWDTGSIASGVPTTMARSIYEYVTAPIAMFSMPTFKFSTDSGENMDFPTVATHGIATQVSGQGTALAGTDAVFGKMTLGAYKYGELYRVATEVVTDTGFDIVDFVARNVGRAVGEVINTDLVVGTGSGEPNGIMTALVGAGTIATGGSLIDPTAEKIIDLVYSVNGNYRRRPSTAHLVRDLTAATYRKLRDGAGGTVGAFLWDASLTQGIQGAEPGLLFGYPVWTDPNVASLASNAKVHAFGDFSAYYIRTVGNFMFERDDSRYFDTDEVGFRGKWRVDGDLIDTAALNVMKRSV